MSEIDPSESIDNINKEIRFLKTKITRLESRLYYQRHIPDTSLLDRSFLKRAFAVWGHYVVAQFIIYISLLIIVFAFRLLFDVL